MCVYSGSMLYYIGVYQCRLWSIVWGLEVCAHLVAGGGGERV